MITNNQIVPFRQTHKAPSMILFVLYIACFHCYHLKGWILQEGFNMGLQMNDNLHVDYVENEFYGKILLAKNLDTEIVKFLLNFC